MSYRMRTRKNSMLHESKKSTTLLKLDALSVMTVEDSDHFTKTTLQNIIPTNVLDKWKLQDDGTVSAKRRSVPMI